MKLASFVFAHDLANFLLGHAALFHGRDHRRRRSNRNPFAHAGILVAANPELAAISDHAFRSGRTLVVVHRTLDDFRFREVLALILHGRIARSKSTLCHFLDFAAPAHANRLACGSEVKLSDVFELGHGFLTRLGLR